MEKKKHSKSKVLLIICEGVSDDVTLHSSLDNSLNNDKIKIKIETRKGDLAYKEDVTEENCIAYIKDYKQLQNKESNVLTILNKYLEKKNDTDY